MARLARIIIPGCAHHVIHHARLGVPLFRDARDLTRYRRLLAEKAEMHGVAVKARLLLADHVELLLVPQTRDGLARAVGEAHRLYARHRDLGANALWAGRFQSCPVAPEMAAAIAGAMKGRAPLDEETRHRLLIATSRGRPFGDPAFIAQIEGETGRQFTPRRRGRKPKW
ncbi:MAG: hypothetical protein JNJ53_05910 [Rhizobiales bacterium]|nr:hypothetical protein [Hyphomicrobiales bacterium]